MALTLRASKGSALTHNELDANFIYLESFGGGTNEVVNVSWVDFTQNASFNRVVGGLYRITDKSNIIVMCISTQPIIWKQLHINKSILTLIAEVEHTYNYTYEVLQASLISNNVFPKILALDANGEPVAVRIRDITKTSLKLTSAVNCTVYIEV